jgi:PAS domain S-box-containing protein
VANTILTDNHIRSILLSAVEYAIITMDESGIITSWSPGAEILFGYKEEDAIGKHTEIIFTPEDKHGNIAQEEILQAKTSGVSMDERWHVRKDNTRFFMSGVMTPLQKTDSPGYVKIARDITSRKLAEEALLLLESKQKEHIVSDQIGQWECDLLKRTIQLNQKASTLTGKGEQDTSLKITDLFAFIHAEDHVVLKQQFRNILNGLPIFHAEFRLKHAESGDLSWLSIYGRVIAHTDQYPTRIMGVIYNINNRKMLEKQKDDFINYASHELKTPLASIALYSEILKEKLETSVDRSNVELLNKLNVSVDRLTQLATVLLDTNTITEGSLRLQPETFDLNEAIASQLAALANLTSTHKIIWAPSPIPAIHADYNRILQVIANLITNAVKYSPEGSTVTISTKDRMENVLVTVSNTGDGIPLKEQPFVFERYYRVSGEQIQKKEGFGLGLYICAEIIRQHHGTISVESEPGKETAFYFTLPYS